MKKTLRYVLYTISLFLIPFLSHTQSSPFLTHFALYGGPLAINNAPVANNDLAALCQGGTTTIAVQANDSDPDGDLMMTAVISGPSNGTATVVGTQVQYTPDFGFYGIDIIQYVICDDGIPSMCDTATITIQVTEAPVADCGPDQTICLNDITVIGTPAIAGNTYLWSPAAGLSATNIAQPFCSPTVTVTTYTLTVNSLTTGCSNTDMVTITVNPLPLADAGPDHTLCQNDSVQLGTPGTFGNTYYWTPIAPLNNNSLDQPMAGPDTTTTFLLIVTTTATGCFSKDSTVVYVIPGPPANAGTNMTICLGQSVTIGSPAVAGNTYLWTPSLGLSSATVAQPSASPMVTTTYVLTVNNTSTGCSGSDSLTITVNPAPIAFTGPNQTICAGDSVMIGGPSVIGNTYLWTPSTGLSADDISNPFAHPAITTTYTLTESAGAGCSASNTVTVTVIPGATANAGTDITICTGASTVIGTPAVAGNTYLWIPALGLSSVIVAQPTASPASTSTYILVVTNTTTGCIAMDSITVTVISPPDANAGPDQTICNGDSVLIGTPAVDGETYSWSPATGLSATTVAQPNAFPSSTTAYTLTVTNAGCSDNDNVIVNIDALPVADAGPDASICPGQSITLGSPAIAGNTYSWSPATGLSASNVAQPVASPLTTTTYFLTVTNSSTSCTNTDTVTITVRILPDANAGADATICAGNSIVIGSPALAGITYSWSPVIGLSASNVAQPTASPLITTTYILTITSGSTLCQDSDTVTITVNPAPIAFTGPNQTICAGDSVMIGGPAVPGNTYNWTPATGLSSTTVSNPFAHPITTTTYTLNESAGGTCVSSNSVTVTVVPDAIANAGPNVSICIGASTIIGTPGVIGNTYLWTPITGLSSATAAQPTASPIVTTTYILTVSNTATGCTDMDTITVTVNPAPLAFTGPNQTICAGDSVMIGGPAVPGNTYNWTPATGLSATTVSNPFAHPIITTTYTLTESAGPSCVSSNSVTVTVVPDAIANAGPDASICVGASTIIGTPGVIGNTYLWTPITGLSSATAAQPTASPIVTTTYTLTVSNTATGCTDTDTVTITVNPAPIAFTGPNQTICAGDSVMIGGPAVPGNTYNWTPATGLSATTVSNPFAHPIITTTYTLNESASAGCSTSNTVTVTVVPDATANAGPDASICVGASTIIGTPAVMGNTYLWTPLTGLSSATVAQPTASPIVTTTYILTVSNTAIGCTDTDTITITVNPAPLAFTGPNQTICAGDSVMIGGPAVPGNAYSWTPATGLSATNVSNPFAHPVITTTYTLTESAGPSCISSNSVTVTVLSPVIANAGPDVSICMGASTVIGTTAISGHTYLWMPVTGLSSATAAQPTANPNVTTTYILTVTNLTAFCTGSDTVTVFVNPLPLANAGNDTAICLYDTITIGVNPVAGNTYGWSPSGSISDSTVSNTTAYPAVTTTYTLTVSDGVCTNSDAVIVTVIAFPGMLAGQDQLVCLGGNVLLGSNANNDYTYLWRPDYNISSVSVAQPTAMPLENTIYIVSVSDASTGCSTTDSVEITVQGGGLYNGISPNADGINDDWTVPLLDCYTSNTVTILNRWGAEVWKTTDYNNTDNKWSGRNLDGDALPDGTYYYVIAYNEMEKRGWVFIKR